MLASYDIRTPIFGWTVINWTCRAGRIDLEFIVDTPNTRAIRGSGRAERIWMSDVLTLTTEVVGISNSTEKVVFRREREQASIVSDLQESMQAHASEGGTNTTNGQPNGPANGSQPIRSETNRAAAPAGSGR